MVQISFWENRTGAFIRQWPNWTGVVPAIGDVVELHFGDNNEDEGSYIVRFRVISGTSPEYIKLFIEKINV